VVNRWWLYVVCMVEGVKLRGFVGMGFRGGFVGMGFMGFPAWVFGGSVTVALWLWFSGYDLWFGGCNFLWWK
jgi:hypothetical protein